MGIVLFEAQPVSPASVLAVKYAQDFDGEFLFGQEQDTVVADAKAELVARRTGLFHVARAGAEITVDSAQHAQCGLAVDSPEIGASFRRPDDSLLWHDESGLPGGKAKLAEDVFMRDALAAVERATGLIERSGFLGGDGLLFHRGRSQRARHRVQKHELQQWHHGGYLGRIELVDQFMGVLLFVAGIMCHK